MNLSEMSSTLLNRSSIELSIGVIFVHLRRPYTPLLALPDEYSRERQDHDSDCPDSVKHVRHADGRYPDRHGKHEDRAHCISTERHSSEGISDNICLSVSP